MPTRSNRFPAWLPDRLPDWLRAALPAGLQARAISLQGPRSENQDNYLLIAADADGRATARRLQDQREQVSPRADWPAHRARLVVLDGMGGHLHGREIAEAAATALADLPPCRHQADQQQALRRLHQQLRDRFASSQPEAPGTTIVWAEIDRLRRRALLLHVGDSRAWLGRDGTWTRLTQDHTLAEFGFRDGRIDAAAYAEQREHPSNQIAQALGYGAWDIRRDADGESAFGFEPTLRLDTAADLPPQRADHADLKTIPLPPGSLLLLASDGLWSGDETPLPPAEPALLSDATALTALAEAAIAAGGTDNTTLLLAGLS